MAIPAIIASILRGLAVDAATDDPQAKSIINAGANMIGKKPDVPAVEGSPASSGIVPAQPSPAEAMFEERRRNDYLDRIGSRMNRGGVYNG